MRKIVLVAVTLFLTGCIASDTSRARTNTYDAVALLGFGPPTTAPLPQTASGMVSITYDGWSIKELLQTDAGKKYLQLLDPTDTQQLWTARSEPRGIYTFQKGSPVPVVILTTALLANRVQRGREMTEDDLKNDPLGQVADLNHCAKNGESPAGYVGLYWGNGKLFLDKNYCVVLGGGIWEGKY